jgi:hypothetical protein
MTQESSHRTAPLGRRQIYIVFGGVMLAMLLGALDQTVLATALPTIVGELGGLSHLSWVVTAYVLAATAATPLWGKIGDLYGRKLLFQIAIAVFLAGSVLSDLSQNMGELIAFRAFQGQAPAACSPSPGRSWAPSSRRASAAATRATSARSSRCPAKLAEHVSDGPRRTLPNRSTFRWMPLHPASNTIEVNPMEGEGRD